MRSNDDDENRYVFLGDEEEYVPVEERYREIANHYEEQIEDYHHKKRENETLFRRWIIITSLLGAVFSLLVSSGAYPVLTSIGRLVWIPAGFLALLAFGGVVGIARWTIVDLLSGINVLR